MGKFYPNKNVEILTGTIYNINLVRWTVDVYCKKTGRWFPEVQVGNMYLHHSEGEGVYAMPDIGASCMLCIPTDLSPPYILSYVSVPEIVHSNSVEDPDEELAKEMDKDGDALDQAAVSNGTVASDYTYGLRRGRAKPGDIVMRGRDGNFVILHRGGVLQVGASELSQRIYLPLRNMLFDLCERYRMTTAGGAIRWGMQELEYEKRETQWMQTIRVFADDTYADLRLTCGHVTSPTPLPPGDEDYDLLKDMKFGDNPVVYELALIPGGESGFVADSGEVYKDTHKNLKLKWTFDRDGKAYGRCDGDAFFSFKKNLFVRVKGGISLECKGGLDLSSEGNVELKGDGDLSIDGASIRLGKGGPGAARMGDQIVVFLPPDLAVIAKTPVCYGNIMMGSNKVMVE